MNAEIKRLRDQWTAEMKAAEEFRSKYAGKPDDMTPDEEASWRKALDSADRIQQQIDLLERQERAEKWASMYVDPQVKIAEAAQADIKPDESLQAKAWANYLRRGKHGLSDAETKILTVADGSEGGYMVAPTQWVNEMIKEIDKETYALAASRVWPLTQAASLGAPAITANTSNYSWTTEIESISPTNFTTGKRELNPKSLRKAISVSNSWLRLAANGEATIREQLALVYAYTIETAWLYGSGAGEPLGVMVADSQGVGTGQDYTTAGSLTVAADDVIGAFYKLRPAYQNRATWIVSPDLLADLRKLKDTANNYVWQPFGGTGQYMVNSAPGTILGRPYLVSEFVTGKTSGSWVANQYAGVVGDFSYYWWAVVHQLEVFVDPYSLASTDSTVYYGKGWMDGMPVLGSAFSRLKIKA